MAISSIGVGSGLPLEELLSDLRRSENHALSAIQSRQVQAENRLSAYGTLKNSIEALQNAAKALANSDTYGALKASVSGDAFSASASTEAIPGEYSIHVKKLATHQTIAMNGAASRDQQIGTGGRLTITLADNNTKTFDLAEIGTSLDDIAAAINADEDLGFNATIINARTIEDGETIPSYRLVLTATDTGSQAAAKSINISDEISGEANKELETIFAGIALEPSNHDAKIDVNGIEIIRSTNTIEDVIEGLTLTLNSTTAENSPARLSITTNDSVTSNAVKAFVSAYNSLQNTVKALTTYDVENQRSSALTGDSLARRLQSDMRGALSVALPDSAVHSLSQLGITTNATSGLLDIDDAKLSEALKNNMGDVQNLLSGPDGLGSRVMAVAERFNSSGGLIGTTTEGINRSITDLSRQYDVTADRIDAKMETYRRQFTALDSMVAQMNSVSTYLTQQLSMLGNLGNDK